MERTVTHLCSIIHMALMKGKTLWPLTQSEHDLLWAIPRVIQQCPKRVYDTIHDPTNLVILVCTCCCLIGKYTTAPAKYRNIQLLLIVLTALNSVLILLTCKFRDLLYLHVHGNWTHNLLIFISNILLAELIHAQEKNIRFMEVSVDTVFIRRWGFKAKHRHQ